MHHLSSRGAAVAASLSIATFLTVDPASARSFRVAQIPNGGARSCQTCHETSMGVVFNNFGSDVRSALVGDGPPQEKDVDWSQLFAKDSDGDGITNGAELGDPDGTWRIGDPNPQGVVSAPGDPNNAQSNGGCGDGILGAAETCDSYELRGATCENQNLGQGEMLCGLDCRLDTTNCDRSTAEEDDGGAAGPSDDGGCAVGTFATPDRRDPASAMVAACASMLAVGAYAARRRQRRFSRSRT